MAWIRQLESGLWAATIYTGLGPDHRLTKSHESKGVIKAWARDQERNKDKGTFRDPRLGEVTIGEIWDEYAADRNIEMASMKRDLSHWENWVAPHWKGKSVGKVTKPHIDGWVTDMQEDGAKGWTQTAAVNVLRTMLKIAVDLGLIEVNPCQNVKVTPPEAHEDRVLEAFEDDMLLANLERRFPGDPTAALFVECLLYTGVRWEELAAVRLSVVRPGDRGFWIHRIREKDGTDRESGKSSSALRFIGLDDDLWPRFVEHMLSVDPDTCDGDLFRGLKGGKLKYDNWLKRIWYKGLLRVDPWTPEQVAGWKAQRRAEGKFAGSRANFFDETLLLADPQPTPHDCRHTFGTRCAEAGMPRHEIAATMGHSPKGNAVDRYLHARNQRLDRARAAMAQVRKQRSPGRPSAGSCVHCGQKLPMSYDLVKQGEYAIHPDTTSPSSALV